MEEFVSVVNVDCAVHRDGEYLFIERAAGEEHAAGLLSFPGGKVEDPPADADAFAATAAREVREEVGVEVGEVSYVLSNRFEADDGTPCLNVVTRAPYESGTAHPREPAEVAATHWLSPRRVLSRDAVPGFIERYIRDVEDSRQTNR
jgi:8-oxo-dGTP diphosphatase